MITLDTDKLRKKLADSMVSCFPEGTRHFSLLCPDFVISSGVAKKAEVLDAKKKPCCGKFTGVVNMMTFLARPDKTRQDTTRQGMTRQNQIIENLIRSD